MVHLIYIIGLGVQSNVRFLSTSLQNSFHEGKSRLCHVETRLWKVFMDGVSSVMGAGAGVVLVTPEGIRLEHSFKLGFKTLNNEAKYKALLARLRVALGLGATNIEIYLDSRLVVSQVDGSFEAKDPQMIDYLKLVKQTMNQFQTVILVQIS